MVSVPLAVKAESDGGGSEKTDYRNLWWFGEIVHKLLLYRSGIKGEEQLNGVGSFRGKVGIAFFPERGLLGDLARFLILYFPLNFRGQTASESSSCEVRGEMCHQWNS